MVSLVERMLKLHKALPKARTAPDKTAITDRIQDTADRTQGWTRSRPESVKPAATDKQIGALVYELYGLTEEGIRIVEGG